MEAPKATFFSIYCIHLPVVIVVQRDAVELHEHPRGEISALVRREEDGFRPHHESERARPHIVAVRVRRHLLDRHSRQRGGVGTPGPQLEDVRRSGVSRSLLEIANVVLIQFCLSRSLGENVDRK